MAETDLNPSQHVERIREILVGRQINRVERRLGELESIAHRQTNTVAPKNSNQVVQQTQERLLAETQELKARIQHETETRKKQLAQVSRILSDSRYPFSSQAQGAVAADLEKKTSERMETLANEMSSRIDARTREILQHLQTEILQWKNQMERDLQSLREVKADRQEVVARFSRMAQAAIAEDAPEKPAEGYLL
ncbi:MAG: hypothetical protein Q7Q71_07500 [Verrucomicrobiota bacterium JB023]|nr:hypothetical protein [Verrucomicrobiota bacterium JB023]